MFWTWRNGGLIYGRDWRRDGYHVMLFWNPRTDAKPNEYRFHDIIELHWQWPRFRGVKLDRI